MMLLAMSLCVTTSFVAFIIALIIKIINPKAEWKYLLALPGILLLAAIAIPAVVFFNIAFLLTALTMIQK